MTDDNENPCPVSASHGADPCTLPAGHEGDHDFTTSRTDLLASPGERPVEPVADNDVLPRYMCAWSCRAFAAVRRSAMTFAISMSEEHRMRLRRALQSTAVHYCCGGHAITGTGASHVTTCNLPREMVRWTNNREEATCPACLL